MTATAPTDPTDPAGLLTVQFLAWLAETPRSYAEVMEAWRSSCPRLTIWEDAVADDLVCCGGDRIVGLTARGRAVLARRVGR
ncbi:MAG TPA: hypothetical protein VHT04_03545 [Stellaceae bacterium]|jgi:hypothetical protein|nr:hypothetical protein [Stellaceae bacterium]